MWCQKGPENAVPVPLGLCDHVLCHQLSNTSWTRGLLPSELKAKVKSLSRVQLFATPWTVACQAPLSVGFPRHEYWSGLLFPSPGNLPDSGIEPMSSTLQVISLPLSHLGKP